MGKHKWGHHHERDWHDKPRSHAERLAHIGCGMSDCMLGRVKNFLPGRCTCLDDIAPAARPWVMTLLELARTLAEKPR